VTRCKIYQFVTMRGDLLPACVVLCAIPDQVGVGEDMIKMLVRCAARFGNHLCSSISRHEPVSVRWTMKLPSSIWRISNPVHRACTSPGGASSTKRVSAMSQRARQTCRCAADDDRLRLGRGPLLETFAGVWPP
jgi:hypothetical protein